MKKWLIACALAAVLQPAFAQTDRWQQRIVYDMDVKLDVNTNKLNGVQKINYTNNSPDTLNRLFFHAYWNAFQPNSSMDVRSREYGKTVLGKDREGKDVLDWDARVRDRIQNLKPDEIGYQRIKSLKIAGRSQNIVEHETIIEVKLDKPLLPKSTTSMEVVFEAQVPIQIRRAGRDNAEGVRFSMAQWYPKMVEYDYMGWHANPYIAREFHGVWGDYNVKISLDKDYMVAATGTLQNPAQIGYGYEKPGTKVTRPAGKTMTWNFAANNVHDFVWAADTAYTMITRQPKNGPLLYVVFKKGDAAWQDRWEKMADTVALAYPLIAKTFGPYPYKNYSFIQGGDGGMEYPMATLIKGPGIGTAVHEWMHTWFQMLMATNESLYSWMDEGFTNYATERILNELRDNPRFHQEANYNSYYRLQRSGLEEPMTTHADHYSTNYAYGSASYGKGSVYLSQLGYIVGDSVRDNILLEYYNQWRFKHPNPNDFRRVAEKESGIELKWYNEYWVNTTKAIDYAIDSLWEEGGKTKVRIRRLKEMPMPIDVQITYKDGSKEMHYIPLNLMYGQKPQENTIPRVVHEAWRWTHPTYTFETSRKLFDISEVQIDPSQRMADIDKRNNHLKIQW